MGSAVPTHPPVHPWREYPITFRAKEMRQIANWIRTNSSGSIIGLDGSGKSDFVGFLCHRVDVLQQYLPPRFPPVHLLNLDLNTLPEPSLSALYRVIIRTFYEMEERFSDEDYKIIHRLYHEVRSTTDPFLSQSALREIIRHFQRRSERVVLILDRFDAACHLITPEMGDSLRGLRDSFKRTLSYVTCMRYDYAYLQGTESLGDLYRLLDGQICYLAPLTIEDAQSTICQRINHSDVYPDEQTMDYLIQMSGGYPALLRVVWQWWFTTEEKPVPAQWLSILIDQPGVQRRLNDIWKGLTQEEQIVLSSFSQALDVKSETETDRQFFERNQPVINELLTKGIYVGKEGVIRVVSSLLADYAARAGQQSRGRINQDGTTGLLWQGSNCLTDFPPKEDALLRYLIQHPYQRHTYTDLIVIIWTEEERYHGVSNDSLFQIIRSLRLKLEPVSSAPVYIVNWRGKPEGGYQFFPEGRPT